MKMELTKVIFTICGLCRLLLMLETVLDDKYV